MRMNVAFQLALTGMLLVPASTVMASKTAKQSAEKIQPQIVRLSLAEGDVRVARDEQQGQAHNADWEKAVTGLPLESGFSLATGEGRAIIELQDASTLYLAPNSVMVFNDLTSTGDVPHTELALLSGTVTLHIALSIKDETFMLRSPTDTMAVKYPDRNDIRVTAYMDALALTPLTSGTVMRGDVAEQSHSGQTLYFRAAKEITIPEKANANGTAMAEWDKWVANSYAQRVAVYKTVMGESGLKTPVPGLEALEGHGKFVDCGEYGKCWQPPQPANTGAQANADSNHASTAPSLMTSSEASDTGGGSSTQPTIIRKTSVAMGPQTAGMGMGMGMMPYFPCGPDSFYYRMSMYGYGGYGYGGMMPMGAFGGMGMYGGYDPYMWAVCHTGSWLFQNNQYLWVPGSGNQIYSQPPVQWIKLGNKQGFVPIHPRDIAGQTPVNLRNGMIAAPGKGSITPGLIKVNNGSSVKVLNSPPRAFREGYSISLARSDSPHITGRLLGAGGAKAELPTNARTVAISYDHGSKSFMVARPVGGLSSMKTVNEPVGSFLARSGVGGFGGPMSYRPGFDGGMRGNAGAFNGGNQGQFRGGAVFNGGAQRGGGEMGGFNGGARMGGNPGGYNGGGGAPAASGGFGGGGGGGGGGMGGGGMGGGGGHVGASAGAAPASGH